MSHLSITDLAPSRELDRAAMTAVTGGFSLADASAFANVNVNVVQDIDQLQVIDIDVLNNNGIIGAGFGAYLGQLQLNVNPTQWAANNVGF